MTITDLKFVKAKLEGKSDLQAAKIAKPHLKTDNSAGVVGHHMAKKPEIQDALAKALQKHQITLDRAIKPITDALDASKTVGVGEYADVVPDHAIRLRASNMSMDLLGVKRSSDTPPPQAPLDGTALLEALKSADFVKLQQIVFGKSD